MHVSYSYPNLGQTGIKYATAKSTLKVVGFDTVRIGQVPDSPQHNLVYEHGTSNNPEQTIPEPVQKIIFNNVGL